ncbi:hypothetical protein BDW59DRAFT_157630 [Aspergillus cavernicola]|uniref:Uncharacterized protein n=1 Tax=Aspergillus cavernicola TaxID=176166 RepID=A0ABR4IX59_9EURO
MWFQNGDFGVILGSGEGKWKRMLLHETPYPVLRECLGITRSLETFVPTQEYDCPSHLSGMIQDYDELRETQKTLPFTESYYGHEVMNWKPTTLLTSCLAAERLGLEERSPGSPQLPQPDFARLPRPLRYTHGAELYIGFRHKETNCYLDMRTSYGIIFGDKKWNIGLTVHYTRPESVKWDIKTCVLGMRVIQLARKERDGEQNVDMYGIVTSGDIIQFHKLKDNGELQSSPVFLLTSSGPDLPCSRALTSVWSYLREIVHVIQTRAPSPSVKLDGSSSPQRPVKRLFELERMIMRSRWRLTPDGKPIDGSDDERARREARYLQIAAPDPGDVELECENKAIRNGDNANEDPGSSVKGNWQKRKPCDHVLGYRDNECDLGADEDESDIEINVDGDFESISSDTDFTWL